MNLPRNRVIHFAAQSTLDSPVKGTVNAVFLTFGLTTGIKEDQKGLPQAIELTKFVQASPTEYKVDDLVPHVMSGTYLLNAAAFLMRMPVLARAGVYAILQSSPMLPELGPTSPPVTPAAAWRAQLGF